MNITIEKFTKNINEILSKVSFKEKNKIKSMNHQRTDTELKLALEAVKDQLEGIDTIRRSGLREKTKRSLSKRLKRFMNKNRREINEDPFAKEEGREKIGKQEEKIKISEINPKNEEIVREDKKEDREQDTVQQSNPIVEDPIEKSQKEIVDNTNMENKIPEIDIQEKEISVRVKEKRSSLSDEGDTSTSKIVNSPNSHISSSNLYYMLNSR